MSLFCLQYLVYGPLQENNKNIYLTGAKNVNKPHILTKKT